MTKDPTAGPVLPSPFAWARSAHGVRPRRPYSLSLPRFSSFPLRSFLLGLLLLPLGACDALSDAVDSTVCQSSGYADSGSVRATVDGDSFSGTCVDVQLQRGTLTIAGADNVVSQNNQEAITLTFPSTEPASYTLGSEVAAAAYAARGETGDVAYVGTSGMITLTAYDESSASGTFSFVAQRTNGDEVVVSEGRFDVSF